MKSAQTEQLSQRFETLQSYGFDIIFTISCIWFLVRIIASQSDKWGSSCLAYATVLSLCSIILYNQWLQSWPHPGSFEYERAELHEQWAWGGGPGHMSMRGRPDHMSMRGRVKLHEQWEGGPGCIRMRGRTRLHENEGEDQTAW